MRVICVCCYRNEADVIEPFVRHAAVFCNELILLDHGSTDESPEIVRQLQREGLPLHLLRDATLGNVEVEQANRLLALAVNGFAADWVLSLDADEFLVGARDSSFLAAAPPNACVKVRSLTYYPHASDSAERINPVERITHRVASDETTDVKVFVPAGLARLEGSFLSQGKHQFIVGTKEAEASILKDAAIAHFSIRSPSQYAMKLASKQLQKLRRICARGDELAYYNAPYTRLKASYSDFARAFHAERLAYKSVDQAEEIVRDPIEYRGGPLRYTKAGVEPDNFIRELLDLSEELARSAASDPASAPLGTAAPRRLAVEATAHPTPGHTEVVNMLADATRFRTVMMTVDCPPEATELQIKLICEPGLIEISELIIDRGAPQNAVYRAPELKMMLHVLTGGAVIAATDVFRLLVSKDPVVLIFRGLGNGEAAPLNSLDVLLRLRVEHRFLSTVVLSPMVLEGISAQQRELAQVSAELQTSLTQLALAEERAARVVYDVGSTIKFGQAGNGEFFLARGWSYPEAWGIWSDGDTAIVRLQLREAPNRPLCLKVRLLGFIRANHPRLSVRVRVGTHQIAVWDVDSADDIEARAVISAERLASRDCELTFEILHPASPAELGISEDMRRLGICLHSMQLQWADEAAELPEFASFSAGASNGNVS